ncbi:MAG: helix-turn-helix transcriptional regulator [Deltaproteobacteria bacterium]|nr:helix-turn-helix transcriptional regulator [Deltaproteobacteria bacterium]
MKAHSWFKQELERVKDTFEYKLEGLELDITENILKVMEEKDISRAELAKKLGVSKASISKMLNYGSNITIRRLLSLADALNCELTVNIAPCAQTTKEPVFADTRKGVTKSPVVLKRCEYPTKPKNKIPEFVSEQSTIADNYNQQGYNSLWS